MNTIQKIRKNRNTLANKIAAINNDLIVNAEELINQSVKTGQQWQKFAAKSIDKSQPLMDRQMDIVFDSLSALKSQLFAGQERLSTLVGREKAIAKAVKATKAIKAKAAKATKKVATKTTKVAKIVAKTTPAKTVKKVIAKVVKPVAKVTAPKAATTKPTTVKATELSAIKGIGPKLEGILADNSIKSFNDLANAKIETIQKILDDAGSSYRTSKPNEWIIAAQNLIK